MDTSKHPTSSGWALAIATLLAIIATIVVNTLSNIFPPGGQNVGEIANTILNGVLITPANYAFAIWGLIYLGLIAYGIYQLGRQQRQDPVIQKVDMFLIVACVAQVAWIYLFTLKYFALSILAMLAILFCLIGAYLVLGIGKHPVHRQRRWYAHYPFSTYLAWISVATIVNVASALYDAGWQGGLTSEIWTIVMIAVSAVIAAIVILTRRDVAFTLVYLWAYGAIAVRNLTTSSIWITCLVAALVLVALLVTRRRHVLAPSEQT